MNKKIPAWLALVIITVIAGASLAFTNNITKDVITEQARQADEKARQAVLADDVTFEEIFINLPLAVLDAVNETYKQLGTAVTDDAGDLSVHYDWKSITGPLSIDVTLDGQGVVKALATDPAVMVRDGEDSNINLADALTGRKAPLNAKDTGLPKKAFQTDYPLVSLHEGLKEGEPVGYVGKIDVKGYGGSIEVIAGVTLDGHITGISVGGAKFAETAGLGAVVKEAGFTDQFIGKPTPVKVIKGGEAANEFTVEAVTAATISSSAVTAGVNTIASQVDLYLNPPAPAGPLDGTTYTASEKGYGGPVAVFVTIKDGAITNLTVGDNAFKETAGLGAKAIEKEFTDQFIGKTVPVSMDDVTTITNATITSKAVVDAINKAYAEKLVAESPASDAAEPSAPVEATETPAIPDDSADVPVELDDDTLGSSAITVSKQGYAGPVTVKVAFDDHGAIVAMKIGDDDFNETANLGAKALEEAFQAQFIGKTPPLTIQDIDAITNATVTTNAVLDAVNEAFDSKR
ncbi:MAG: FMN-binding protein [Clostridiales bacterium]|nr:FMN-binding protein [Clostridiales bacterium]